MQDKGAAERSRTADFRMQAISAPESKEVGVMKFQDLQLAGLNEVHLLTSTATLSQET